MGASCSSQAPHNEETETLRSMFCSNLGADLARRMRESPNLSSYDEQRMCVCSGVLSIEDLTKCMRVEEPWRCRGDDHTAIQTAHPDCAPWLEFKQKHMEMAVSEKERLESCVSQKTELIDILSAYDTPENNMSDVMMEARPILCDCMEGLTAEQRSSCKGDGESWTCSDTEDTTILCDRWREYINRNMKIALDSVQCNENLKNAVSASVGLLEESEKQDHAKVKEAARGVLCRCFGFENEDYEDRCKSKDTNWECLNEDSEDEECNRWSEFEQTHLEDHL